MVGGCVLPTFGLNCVPLEMCANVGLEVHGHTCLDTTFQDTHFHTFLDTHFWTATRPHFWTYISELMFWTYTHFWKHVVGHAFLDEYFWTYSFLDEYHTYITPDP